jgi:UDP-N-acetylglucosamine--N-acetylmuramyl-(pentapeptide) pyrophosphoryl-undecaprenol N-acetylglucosamine transferase
MRVLIAGGGTGGHLYPGIALARAFQGMGITDILFVGTARGIESEVLQKEGFPLAKIHVSGIMNKGIFKTITSILLLPIGLIDSIKILREFRPDIVVGIGGYTSGPIVAMAMLLRIKRVILEPNLIPGITNRLLAPVANMIAVAFEETKRYFRGSKVVLTGNPVREEIIFIDNTLWSPLAGTEGFPYTLFVFGGSQGAHSINVAMIDALDYIKDLKDRIFIIHQTGKPDFSMIMESYRNKGFKARIEPYIFDIARIYRLADLIVSRAGATTVAEIMACGRPAILIPFPYSTHGHQEKNAMALKKAGAAEVIDGASLNGRLLGETIRRLLSDREGLRLMGNRSRSLGRKDAAREIALICNRLAGGEI